MDFSKLEEYLSGLSAHGIPACDIMVMKDHKLLYRTMAGYSDHEGTVPVSDKDLYNIYSTDESYSIFDAPYSLISSADGKIRNRFI